MKISPKIYCEIGLNHMGEKKYLNSYLKVLLNPNVHGITLQLPKQSFYKKNPQFNYLKLKKETVLDFLNLAKKYKKEIGIVTNDFMLAKFFKKKIDFIKILSQDFLDIKLIKKFYILKLPLYLSVGFSSSNQIKHVLSLLEKKIQKKNTILLHTSFDKKTNKKFNNVSKEDFSLKRIRNLKKKFKLKVGFTNHYKDLRKIINSVKFSPDVIFFYIKLNKRLNYPDKDWAVNIIKIKMLTKKIIKINELI